MIKGQIISGSFSQVLARQKAGCRIEIGELLTGEAGESRIIFQVYDLVYASQMSRQNLEMIAGVKLEEDNDLEIFEPHMRNYMIAAMKSLAMVKGKNVSAAKILPEFFSNVMELEKEDVAFLTKPDNPLSLGRLRSGSKVLDVDVFLDGKKVLCHHLLIAGTTGRGKSVFMSNLLWSIAGQDYCGALVLDPHDEYYGRNSIGLKNHPSKKVAYYTGKNPPAGTSTLAINLLAIRPQHFEGAVDFSDAQRQALNLYYKEFGEKWIESIINEDKLSIAQFRDDTLAVVKRRILHTLDIDLRNSRIECGGVFKINGGDTTVTDIAKHLESGKVVIIDTSNLSGTAELIIGSIISHEIFNRYRRYKVNGTLDEKPVISIILEEAPRVLGKDVLERGPNIFSTIAREGRKFKVGIAAITQLPSLIPREILANMNTKIILGTEMKPERQALIDSASQDLSTDDRTIASLDIGEAIITSNFLKFTTPIKIPFFEETVKKYMSGIPQSKTSMLFSELKNRD